MYLKLKLLCLLLITLHYQQPPLVARDLHLRRRQQVTASVLHVCIHVNMTQYMFCVDNNIYVYIVHSDESLRKKSFSEYYDLSLQLVMLALDKVEALVGGRNHSLVS